MSYPHLNVGRNIWPIGHGGVVFAAIALLVALGTAVATAQEAGDLAQSAATILRDRCLRCHGGTSTLGGLDVTNRQLLVARRGDPGQQVSFVVPGDEKQSSLLRAIQSGYMPPPDSPERTALSDNEKQTLAKWITSGATFPVRRNVAPMTTGDTLAAMRKHLMALPADARKFTRFFTLSHLYNNDAIAEADLRYTRAALAKVVNSLSRKPDLVYPTILPNTEETLLAIDLRQLGWDRAGAWNQVAAVYPYGITQIGSSDPRMKQLTRDVEQLSGTRFAMVRADWFVMAATRPPLVYELLNVPENLNELTRQLGFDLAQDFMQNKVQRAGFAHSHVSAQNRLVERHSSSSTAYCWISYDFRAGKVTSDLVRFPLGPKSEQNPFNDHAFEHDGGELLWSLPNGMQAYMLIDQQGKRLDEGPVDIVFDRSAASGQPQIVAGLSCMMCHREGILGGFRDEVRNSGALAGATLEKIEAIYPTANELQKLMDQDRQRYETASASILSRYLKTDEDASRPIHTFAEPIRKVAALYLRDLGPAEAAAELGMASPDELISKIQGNSRLLKFGLGIFVERPPGGLKRAKWSAREGTTMMQDVAIELGLGAANQ